MEVDFSLGVLVSVWRGGFFLSIAELWLLVVVMCILVMHLLWNVFMAPMLMNFPSTCTLAAKFFNTIWTRVSRT